MKDVVLRHEAPKRAAAGYLRSLSPRAPNMQRPATLKQSTSFMLAHNSTTPHPINASPAHALRCRYSLHLRNNLLCPPQTLHHLLTLLPPPNRIIRLLEQIIKFLCPIHLLQKMSLHFFLCVSAREKLSANTTNTDQILPSVPSGCTYSTRLSIIALGTISIIVLRTIL
jgi:hypothetical protein